MSLRLAAHSRPAVAADPDMDGVLQQTQRYNAADLAGLYTSFQVYQILGESVASISVNKLQSQLLVGNDAWGRNGRTQPVLLSTHITLRHPFELASSTDTVTDGTIHYGILSKKIQEACAKYQNAAVPTLEFLDEVYCTLIDTPTGKALCGDLIMHEVVKGLVLEIFLPKASLLGRGVSIRTSRVFSLDQPVPFCVSSVLAIHELKVPTVIGVNANEREQKQMVIASVEIEPWLCYKDIYNELEQIVVKSIEESSFQTLESLANHLCSRIIQYFIVPWFPKGAAVSDAAQGGEQAVWQTVKVSLEKPTAVTFAEAPCVSLRMSADPHLNDEVNLMYIVPGPRETLRPPYPLRDTFLGFITDLALFRIQKQPVSDPVGLDTKKTSAYA